MSELRMRMGIDDLAILWSRGRKHCMELRNANASYLFVFRSEGGIADVVKG